MGADAPRKLKHCGATGKKPVAPQALRLLLLLPNQSMNSEMTESPLMMRLNVSASSGAHVN